MTLQAPIETPNAPPVLTADEAVAAARDLAPAVRARAEEAEALRSIPAETMDALLDSGLLSIAVPRRYGGSELGFEAWLRVLIELGGACGSTGWVAGVLLGHMYLVGFLQPEAQDEVFGNPRALVASLLRMASAPAERVEGGYRWRGAEARFCSGVDFCDWLLLGGAVTETDGTVANRFMLIPREDAELEDDWDTMGLRGTGSKTVRIRDAFIPDYRTIQMSDLVQGTTPGGLFHGAPRYRLPHVVGWPMSLAGGLFGLARAACAEAERGLARRLGPLDSERLADQTPALVRLARAEADVETAIKLVMDDARDLDRSEAGRAFTRLDRARYRRNLSYAAHVCRGAVNSLFEAAGGGGIYRSQALQRIWRDMNAGCQHFGLSWELAAAGYARAKLDLPPSKSDGPGR